jgi:hypothetical protein
VNRLMRSPWLVVLATAIGVVLFWFRPGGVEGPRPESVASEGKGFDHAAFTAVLSAVVGEDGRVDYGKLRADPAPLDRYLGQLRAASPASAPHRFKSDDDRLAYYVNAYNAFVLAAIRDHCPIQSVRDAYVGDGLFWRVSFLMGEEEVTLSTLESEHVRAVAAHEPTVHFALVKGAKGFPPLPRQAYTAEDVRPRLAELAHQVVRNPAMVQRTDGTLKASELFQWYLGDFGGDLVDYLKRVAPDLAEGTPKVEYVPFDWSLNGSCG